MRGSKEDVDFIRRAYEYAAEYSTDKNTQNGAILVRDGQIVAYGANHFPKNVLELDERFERPLKYLFTEHAERNVVFDAARRGVKTGGTIMYAPWFACADCGRAIIQAGISEVVGHIGPEKWYLEGEEKNHNDWTESIKTALEMFNEACIKHRWIDDKIGGIEIIFGGKVRTP